MALAMAHDHVQRYSGVAVMTSVSCLVISKTTQLLNQLLQSLWLAKSQWTAKDEILCSWNGEDSDLSELDICQSLPFRIAQKQHYHFAANINSLAEMASGELLVLLNDDLVLDPGCLDLACGFLNTNANIGIVGSRLRTPDGQLGHAGILFNGQGLPYNRLRPERLAQYIDLDHQAVATSGSIAAVTGALMAVRRREFQATRMRETFDICGEDVALCLDYLAKLGLETYYHAGVTAIHAEKSTRGSTSNLADTARIAEIFKSLSPANKSRLNSLMIQWSTEEADLLESMIHGLEQTTTEHHDPHTFRNQDCHEPSAD